MQRRHSYSISNNTASTAQNIVANKSNTNTTKKKTKINRDGIMKRVIKSVKDDKNIQRSIVKRIVTSIGLGIILSCVIFIGHPAILGVVMLTQCFMFHEIITLAYSELLSPGNEIDIPLFRTQNWYWYFVATYFTYGKIFKKIFSFEIPYHMLTSFILFAIGFVSFVLMLKPGMYRTQFCMFSWLWSTLSFIILQSTLIIHNLFRGLYWFLFPILLIISNDTWAYFWGMTLGQTP